MSIDVREIRNFLQSVSGELRALSQDIWSHPELAWQEKHASEALTAFLEKHDFLVQKNYLDLSTSFHTEFGSAGRTFAVAAEYDALPEIGHGCGHNLICTAAVAATLAVRKWMNENRLPGKFILLGTPAEEGGGGKVVLLEKGCLQGVDAVMMVHPSSRTIPDPGSTALLRYKVEFTGVAAHAGATPERGINALDAVMLLFAAVNAYRQQLSSNCRIHGIVDNGGVAPNIIPGESSCFFYLRSAADSGLEALDQRFRDMVKGAALMTGCQYKMTETSRKYRTRRPNEAMNKQYLDNMETLGCQVQRDAAPLGGSSDFGNFSHRSPGIHPYFAVADHTIALHSLEMAEAANSDYGHERMLCAAASMAHIALLFLSDSRFSDKVTNGFIPD